MSLDTSISKLPKIGTIYASRLKNLKIFTVADLIYHFPFRYEDLGSPKKISELRIGETYSILGDILSIHNIRTRFGKILTKATVNDGTASIESVWFNQPYLTNTLKIKSRIGLAGKVDIFSNKPTFISPEYELFDNKDKRPIHTRGLVSIYPETSGVSSKWLRARISLLLPGLLNQSLEILPPESLTRNNLIPLQQALRQIHFPSNIREIEQARRRLAFDELLLFQLKGKERNKEWQDQPSAIGLHIDQEKILRIIENLPFTLTNAQKRVLKEILVDLSKSKPMNRLLQGDVGSGKTVVAAILAYVAFLNGLQTAVMAPTEILAIQHYHTIKGLLESLGVKIGLTTSSRNLSGEDIDVLVGTHSLISKGVNFKKLGLIVIDEQHRFGVQQRAVLRKKANSPHVLSMTATPIPRSLALTLFGDLAISIIDELPPERQKIKTYLVPPEKRTKAYQFIKEKVSKGKQAYILCPLVETSDTLETVKSAIAEFKRLQEEIFPDFKLGLLHGRLKTKEKEKALQDFIKKETQILVATPVVEVGIDVPNATIMVIEGSERFGLASLHQLRGRVGRSAEQSFCLLFTESNSKQALERLSALEKHHVGLELAEIDLKMRGPGQIYGVLQSGFHRFKIARLTDLPIIEAAKKEAEIIFPKLGSTAYKQMRVKVKKEELISPD